jgi:hypothetical protein
MLSHYDRLRLTCRRPRPCRAWLLIWLCGAHLLGAGAVANAGTIFHYSDAPLSGRVTSTYVPDGDAPIRGILFNGNGAGGNASAEANHRHKQAWADKHRFAIVATGFFGRFSDGYAGDDWRVITAAIADAAARSGHPELAHAPFVAWGFSNGGQMAYGLARLLPQRALAFIANKGGFYATDIGTDPLAVPALWIAGQLDNTNNRRATIEALYKAGRAAGAPWAWIEECNLGHSPGNSESLAFAFFEAVIAQRYPAEPGNEPTATSSPILLPVDHASGWLVDQEHTAWGSGYPGIRAASDYPGDALLKGWLPDATLARLYRAMASYDTTVPWDFAANTRKAVQAVMPYNPHNPAPGADWQAVYHPDTTSIPPLYTVNIAPSHAAWLVLEIYDGSTLLASVSNDGSYAQDGTPGDQVTVTLPALDSSPNLNALYSELLLPGGVRRTSHVLWLTADAERAPPPELPAPVNVETSISDSHTVALSWSTHALQATAYEVQRRCTGGSSASIIDNGDPRYTSVGNWILTSGDDNWYGSDYLNDGAAAKGTASVRVTPGLSGDYEIAAWQVPQLDGDDRVPVTVQHSGGTAVLHLNQSTIAPTNAWDFRAADANVDIRHSSVVNTGSQFDSLAGGTAGNWTATIPNSLTTDGNLRLRPNAGSGTSTYAGYVSTTNHLDYSTGIWILEVDLAGWNVVGDDNNQWFQLGFLHDNAATITCGLVLQQNAAGLALWGRALGSGSAIGSVTAPIKQFPASQTSAVSLRLVADFSTNRYWVYYRDSSTAGDFVEAPASGTIDPARRGRALRMQLVQDWSQPGEFIDLTRMRTYAPAPVSAAGQWVVIGIYALDTESWVSLSNHDTTTAVRADAFRFAPYGSADWTTLANLPQGSTTFIDSSPVAGGSCEYRVRARAGDYSSAWSPIATATLPDNSPYRVWAATIDWQGADSAPLADANQDGISNYLSFVFGGDPLAASSQHHRLPTVTQGSANGQPMLSFSFNRARADIDYHVEVSTSLAPDDWHTETTNPGTVGERVTISLPITPTSPRFLRIRCTTR